MCDGGAKSDNLVVAVVQLLFWWGRGVGTCGDAFLLSPLHGFAVVHYTVSTPWLRAGCLMRMGCLMSRPRGFTLTIRTSSILILFPQLGVEHI
jgi:hypothetical protein